MNKNTERLEEIHEALSGIIFAEQNENLSKDKIDSLTANIIYYIYASLNKLDNITVGFKNFVDTTYADSLIKYLRENHSDITESIGNVPPADFDVWFRRF